MIDATPLPEWLLFPERLLLAGLLFGWVIEGLVLLWASRSGWLAEVNARSSHDSPTPTMGGLMLVVVVGTFLIYLASRSGMPAFVLALTSGFLLLALLGGWDDLRPLGARTRLVAQAAASAALVWALTVDVPQDAWAWWAMLPVLVGLVWFTNLFNFMDGIDGYAGSQALFYCVGVLVLSIAGQATVGVGDPEGLLDWSAGVVWLLAGACIAFLSYNWPPARIFMGDVGSYPVGFLIGGLALHLHFAGVVPLVASLILLAGFWFDASYTLCVRMTSKQRFMEAHRSHLYQRLAQRKGHRWTTLAFWTLAHLWLLPLALVSMRASFWAIGCLCLACLPLLVGCVRMSAGKADA